MRLSEDSQRFEHPKAHPGSDPPPGAKRTHLDVDETGVSMSWRTAVSIISAIVAGAVMWTVFTATLTRRSELDAHDANNMAHPVVVSPGDEPVSMPVLLKQHDRTGKQLTTAVAQISQKVDAQGHAIEQVQQSMNEARAETLADRAADKVKDAQRSRDVWQSVRSKAMRNLNAGLPAREGIDSL